MRFCDVYSQFVLHRYCVCGVHQYCMCGVLGVLQVYNMCITYVSAKTSIYTYGYIPELYM